LDGTFAPAIAARYRIRSMNTPRRPFAFDTLGAIADRGYLMFGSCLRCGGGYRPALGPPTAPSMYDIDLAALIADSGRDCHIVGMRAVPCPYCGSRRTEIRLLPAKTGEAAGAALANDRRDI
jgi:hypothetical protein